MNITYLLGAGASFDALPIVNQIPERLYHFSNEFYIHNLHDVIGNNENHSIATKYLNSMTNDTELNKANEIISRFHEDILWLRNETQKHTSIDTYAKKLYLQKDYHLLKKLKFILSCFFMYEQTRRFDKRYDSFFASILESLDQIPNNIKIVSWNYDSQLEIAFSRFSGSTLESSKDKLNIFSKGNFTESLSTKENFSVFKVNGTTTVIDKDRNPYDIIIDYDIDDINLAHSIFEIYGSPLHYKNHMPNMSFAWEETNENSIFFGNLINTIDDTDILIVIGYSFPFFNRKIDEIILNSITNLRKVYVQDPNNAEAIIQKVKSLLHKETCYIDGIGEKIKFEAIKFPDQFFIPIEF